MRILLISIAGFVAVVVLGSIAIDEGEVVGLTTFDAEGNSHLTQLWIVDLDGHSYLRAAAPDNAWLERLREQPEAVLARNGEAHAVLATPVAGVEVRRLVNRAMADKYGSSDRLYSSLFDRSVSVPVRISPRSVDGAAVSRRSPGGSEARLP